MVALLVGAALQLSDYKNPKLAMWFFIVGGFWVLLVIVAWIRERKPREMIVLTPSFEDLGGGVMQLPNGRTYSDLTNVWIEVENEGKTVGVFSAQIRGVTPVEREDGHRVESVDVDEVAWEHVLDPDCGIRPGKRARLKVATVAQRPPIFWFWTARSATWSPSGHGIGWRLRPLYPIVEFNLEVLTPGEPEKRRCQMEFQDGQLVSFGFVDQEAVL